MAYQVNPAWINRVQALLDAGQPIDEASGYNPATQWLIIRLAKLNRPFALHNLGAGVKRVTTETDTCPCCKRKLNP